METTAKVVGVALMFTTVASVVLVICCALGWAFSAAFNVVVIDWAGVQMPRMDWWVGTLVVFMLGFIRGGNGGGK